MPAPEPAAGRRRIAAAGLAAAALCAFAAAWPALEAGDRRIGGGDDRTQLAHEERLLPLAPRPELDQLELDRRRASPLGPRLQRRAIEEIGSEP